MVAFIETARKVLVLVIVTKIIGICCGPSHWTGDGGCVSHEDVDAIVKMPKKVFSGLLTKQASNIADQFSCEKPSESREFHERKKGVFSARGRFRGRGSGGEAAGCQGAGDSHGLVITSYNLKPEIPAREVELRGEFGTGNTAEHRRDDTNRRG
jgi:hypothetical protein